MIKILFSLLCLYGFLYSKTKEHVVYTEKRDTNISKNSIYTKWQGDYDKALKKARKEGKMLLVFLIKNQEPELSLSRKILKEYFMHRSYISSINQKTVAVLVTYMQKNSYPVEMYYTIKFPVLFLVDSQNELFLGKPLYANEITPQNIKSLLALMKINTPI